MKEGRRERRIRRKGRQVSIGGRRRGVVAVGVGRRVFGVEALEVVPPLLFSIELSKLLEGLPVAIVRLVLEVLVIETQDVP